MRLEKLGKGLPATRHCEVGMAGASEYGTWTRIRTETKGEDQKRESEMRRFGLSSSMSV